MKNEPCIRLGMRIRPKISEKPDDSRNSRAAQRDAVDRQGQPQAHAIGSPSALGSVARSDRRRLPELDGAHHARIRVAASSSPPA